MATLRSNKENLSVGFNAPPPKTPGAKPHQQNVNMFTTPATTNRVPLGGKDHNANHFTVQKQQQSVKRQPLSGPNSTKKKKNQLVEKQVTIAELAVGDEDDDFEIEFIPEKSKPLDDLPLDHIELDYNAIGQLCKQPSVDGEDADVFKKPVKAWLDDLDKIPVLSDSNSLPPAQPKQRDHPSTKQPLEPRSGALKPKKPALSSFMAPTKSAQAKQRVPTRHRHHNKENLVMHHQPPTKKYHHQPPAMDIDVSMDQLHQSLEWDF